MANYTIEDIELIRRKSGISYQEAVALLDYHNGNVARALVDLERNGRIKPEREHAAKSTSGHKGKKEATDILSKLFRYRIKVRKEQTIILNLSVLFSLLALLISPHLVLIGVILMLVLGYKVSLDKHDQAFAGADLEKMVRSAAQNVKDSVAGMAQEFTDNEAFQDAQAASDRTERAKAAETETEKRSYYQSNPAATTYRASYGGTAPTLQVPVQVESQEGKVSMESDQDGFTSATIE